VDGFRSSRVPLSKSQSKHPQHSKKVDLLDRVPSAQEQTLRLILLVLFAFGFYSVNVVAQAPHASATSQLIHGSVVSSQGQPIANATVEIRDQRGIQVGGSLTNNAGTFEISTAAAPGEYTVLAAKEMQTGNQWVKLGQPNLEVRIALPVMAEGAAPQSSRYTVSAARLSVPAKVGKSLEAAQKRFDKADWRGAIAEIDRALQIDPNCAWAFSMRAYIKLAGNDVSGAVEDAARAVALDSYDSESYVALATAYNYAKEFKRAAEAARKALGLRPDAWQARLEMAKSLYGQDQCVVALSVLDGITRDFPDVHLMRANVLMRLSRSREAADEFNIFLKQAPNDPRNARIRQIVATAQ
jgi:tetratricopeptide (TPR) repeat protein